MDEETVIFATKLFAWFVVAFWLFVWIGFLTSVILARLWIVGPKTNALGAPSIDSSIVVDPLLPSPTFPGVSILKPLTGSDSVLHHNLESWFKLRYPLFELMFCVHDVDDPAVKVVHSLIDKYPGVDAKLVVSGGNADISELPPYRRISPDSVYKMPLSPTPSFDDVEKQKKSAPAHASPKSPVVDLSTIVNPKIRNVLPAYESAKYDLVFLSDCNIEAEPETIHDVVSKLGPRVGTVCQMHFVKDPPSNTTSFGSIVNKVFFGTQNAKALLFLALLRITTTVSAAMLIRKSALDKCGGLRAFGCYLAEDLHIGLALSKDGWTHKLGSRLAWQNPARVSVSDVFNRIIRWKRLRQATSPSLIIVDPMSECIMLGLTATWALGHLFPVLPFPATFLAHCIVWFFADFLLLTAINKQPLKFPKFAFLLAWLVRELSAPVLHIISLLSRRVVWRGNEYYLRFGGKTERLMPTSPLPSDDTLLKRRRAISLTLTPEDVPVFDMGGKSPSSDIITTPIYHQASTSSTLVDADSQTSFPSSPTPSLSDMSTSTGRRDKSRRHQHQPSSPPSLCAVNA